MLLAVLCKMINNDITKYFCPQFAVTMDEESASLTKDKLILICEYWFRTMMNDTNISIEDISNLMANYYNFIIAYKGKFIQQNCHQDIEISENGTKITLINDRNYSKENAYFLEVSIYIVLIF